MRAGRTPVNELCQERSFDTEQRAKLLFPLPAA